MTVAASPDPSSRMFDTSNLFERHPAAREAMDPDKIAALHSAELLFWLQDGSSRIQGQEVIHRHIAGSFQAYGRFDWDTRRVIFGHRFWVIEYDTLLELKDRQGATFVARVSIIDVVDVNDAGEVLRKDVFMDAVARQAGTEQAELV